MVEGKIKGKDLQFDKSLPPFLQRLHAQKGGFGDADRHERAIARPKKAKDDNEDDGPTMVDETGETLTKDEYEKLTTASAVPEEGSASELEARPTTGEEASAAKVDRKVTDGAASKKRKVAKIVGEEEGTTPQGDDAAVAPKVVKKAKKKAKPVKLAFDDDEGT
jgi:hypothetical protein